MTLPRQPTDELPPVGAHMDLDGDRYNHLVRVLRLRVGDRIALFDQHGREAQARIEGIDKETLRVRIEQLEQVEREPGCKVYIAIALTKGEKIDWVLQKCTELGVAGFCLFPTERSVVRLSKEKAEKRLERWRRIVVSACAQSGRTRTPEVLYFEGFRPALENFSQGSLIILDPMAETLLTSIADQRPEAVTLAVGPEGGFTDDEIEVARAHRLTPARLGPLTLRAETAAVAATVPFVVER
jgi:16S rRNA (uracil1498-N3)-methyltransferase